MPGERNQVGRGKYRVAVTENAVIPQEGYFRTSLEYTMAELRRIELILKFKIKEQRQRQAGDNNEKLRGLFVSDEEINQILGDKVDQDESTRCGNEAHDSTLLSELTDRLEKSIARRKKESHLHGVSMRLDFLTNLYGLGRFEKDTLLVSLLPEIDLKYQRLLAYLQDDITRKTPSVGLVLNLFCDSTISKLKARDLLTHGGSLIKHQLIHLYDEYSRPSSFLDKSIRLDNRITGFLLESDQLDERLSGISSLVNRQRTFQDLILPDGVKSSIKQVTERFKDTDAVYYLHGTDEAGKQELAEAIGREIDKPLLVTNIDDLQDIESRGENVIPLIFREGELQKAILYFSGFQSLLSDDRVKTSLQRKILAGIPGYSQWVIISGDKEWQLKESLWQPYFSLEMSVAEYSERKKAWTER